MRHQARWGPVVRRPTRRLPQSMFALHRTANWVIVFVIFAAYFGASPAVTSAPAAGQSIVTGVSIYGESYTDVSNASLSSSRVKNAGGTTIATQLRWDQVAPGIRPADWNPADPSEPHYNWSSADQWVTAISEAGLVPQLMIYGAPVWADSLRSAERCV